MAHTLTDTQASVVPAHDPYRETPMRRISAASRLTKSADPDTFVLPATTQVLLGRDDGMPLRMYRVSFEAGARMNWHRHDGPQLLVGLSGRCVVENRAGKRVEIAEGDLVVVEAGEEHWHGAPTGQAGAHLAVNLGENTEWLERPPTS